MTHKSGFVNIIGNPNVGKSTLSNALLGEKLSIISPKAQTTRHRILGIMSGEDFQIVFSDLPGILIPHYKLQEKMLTFVLDALSDADLFLYMTEPDEDKYDESIIEKIKVSNVPLIVILNKIDTTNPGAVEQKIASLKVLFGDVDVIPVSALKKANLDVLLNRIIELLPENEAFYPKDELTDKSTRFFISEIIREKILLNFYQEIPYSVEVVVESFKEDSKIIRIGTLIYVGRESQKMILLGKGGKAIKNLGIQSRKDIEEFLGKQVYLELTVKVSKDWRDSDKQLKYFGYTK